MKWTIPTLMLFGALAFSPQVKAGADSPELAKTWGTALRSSSQSDAFIANAQILLQTLREEHRDTEKSELWQLVLAVAKEVSNDPKSQQSWARIAVPVLMQRGYSQNQTEIQRKRWKQAQPLTRAFFGALEKEIRKGDTGVYQNFGITQKQKSVGRFAYGAHPVYLDEVVALYGRLHGLARVLGNVKKEQWSYLEYLANEASRNVIVQPKVLEMLQALEKTNTFQGQDAARLGRLIQRAKEKNKPVAVAPHSIPDLSPLTKTDELSAHHSLAVVGVRTFHALPLTSSAPKTLQPILRRYLWTWRAAEEKQLCELIGDVHRSLKENVGAELVCRDWATPVLLQKGRQMPAMVDPAHVPDHWKTVLPLVQAWVDKQSTNLGVIWDRKAPQERALLDSSGLLKPAHWQPKQTELAGDHPLVLQLMLEVVRNKLKGAAPEKKSAQYYLQWMKAQSVTTPESCAAVVGFVWKLTSPKADLFAQEEKNGAWKNEAEGLNHDLRTLLTNVVSRFDQSHSDGKEWSEKFVPLFLDNRVLQPKTEKATTPVGALRVTGRRRLLQAWSQYQQEGTKRQKQVAALGVPSQSLSGFLYEITQKDLIELNTIPTLSEKGKTSAKSLGLIVGNPWCEPWLLGLPANARQKSLEEDIRLRGWVRSMTPASMKYALSEIWPRYLRQADNVWEEAAALDLWTVLRNRARYDAQMRARLKASLDRLEARLKEGEKLSSEDRSRLSAACWLGISQQHAGLIKALEEARRKSVALADQKFLDACGFLAFAAANALDAQRPDAGKPLGLLYPAYALDRSKVPQAFARILQKPAILEHQAACEMFLSLTDILEGTNPEHLFDPKDCDRIRASFGPALTEGAKTSFGHTLPILVAENLWKKTTRRDASNGPNLSLDQLSDRIIKQNQTLSRAGALGARAVLRVWKEQLRAHQQQRLLSISPRGLERDHPSFALMTNLRRELGSTASFILSKQPETTLAVVGRTSRTGYLTSLPRQALAPWWSLSSWDRESSQPASSSSEASREISLLVGQGAVLERQTQQYATQSVDLDGLNNTALPERPYQTATTELADVMKKIAEVEKEIDKVQDHTKLLEAIHAVQQQIETGLDFDLVAVEHVYREALEELRAAEFRMESQRYRALAAEVEYHASELLVRAAKLKQQEAALHVLVRRRNVDLAKLETQILTHRVKVALGLFEIEKDRKAIAVLEEEKKKIQVEILAAGVAVLENEIELVKAALINDTPVNNPDTGKPFETKDGKKATFPGHIGALAHLAEAQVQNYVKNLAEEQGKLEDQLQKVREAKCIKAITQVVGSLVSLIPGAGPFIGMGIIAAGEIAAGIHSGQSFGQIAVGLIDNTLDIANKAGLDIEMELNKLGDKVGAKVGALFGDLDKSLGPILEEIPNVLDEQVLSEVLSVAGVKGPLADIFKELRGGLGDLKEMPKNLSGLGSLVVPIGRKAALAGETPEQLFDNLKNGIVNQLDQDGKFRSRIQNLKGAAEALGVQADALRRMDNETQKQIAQRLGGLILARAAPKMIEQRDRALATLGTALTRLQDELRKGETAFQNLETLIQIQFAKEKEVQTFLQNFIQLIPEEERKLVLRKVTQAQKEAEEKRNEIWGKYQPLPWATLEKPAEKMLQQLLPNNPSARRLLLGRLRLTLDPDYAQDRLQNLVQPWQIALQQKMDKVQEKLSTPLQGGGDQEAQLKASIERVKTAQTELGTVLNWVKSPDSNERAELRDKLAKLQQDLEIEKKRLKMGEIDVTQAQIRVKIAETRIEIGRQKIEIARLRREKVDLDLENAETKVLIAEIHEKWGDVQVQIAKKHQEASAHLLKSERLLFKAAQAEVLQLMHRVRAKRAQLQFAINYRDARPRMNLQVDPRIVEKRSEHQLLVERACQRIRELRRLLRVSGVSIQVPVAQTRWLSHKDLVEVAEAIKQAWSKQEYDYDWMETLDLSKEQHRAQIEALFSEGGLELELIPTTGQQDERARVAKNNPHRIVRKQRELRHARLIACVLMVGKTPQNVNGQIHYTAIALDNPSRRFWWRGYENGRPLVDALAKAPVWGERPSESDVVNRSAVRDLAVLLWGESTYHAYTAAGGKQVIATNRKKLDDRFLTDMEMKGTLGMHQIHLARFYQKKLGPPLFGVHRVRVQPPARFESPDHVRLCLLYVYSK